MEKVIVVRADVGNGTTPVVKCDRGCVLGYSEAPEHFARFLENSLNEQGQTFARVLNDNNKYLCWSEVTGAYIGNVSTDREFMVPFLTRLHLDNYIAHFAPELPQLEYALENPFRDPDVQFVVDFVKVAGWAADGSAIPLPVQVIPEAQPIPDPSPAPEYVPGPVPNDPPVEPVPPETVPPVETPPEPPPEPAPEEPTPPAVGGSNG